MWFEELVGFEETTASDVRARLSVQGDQMTSLVNGRVMGCGVLEVVSLGELRDRTAALVDGVGASSLREQIGDAGALHRDPANATATFQVASQFNLLEMVSPEVSPEAGVTRYQDDPTQGPACALACGAGTIYRNYFVELNGHLGQSATVQVDCLHALGTHLFPDGPLPWSMTNGYALFDRSGLEALNVALGNLNGEELDAARAKVQVGIHHDVEVTTAPTAHHVTQVYCSALPVAYNRAPSPLFEPLARIVLDAAYEATLRAAVLTASRTGKRTVFLTLVGGGVFGNDESWITDAIDRAFRLVAGAALDVAVVSYRSSNPAVTDLVRRS